jgi:quinol monooxygenase YgiN
MNSEISWRVELTIKPEQFSAFRSLTNEMTESTKLEEGVLFYERFLGEDGSKVFLYERYANSEAAIAHLRGFRGKFDKAFAQLVKRDRFLVFGAPTDELKKILREFDAIFLNCIGGFSALGAE